MQFHLFLYVSDHGCTHSNIVNALCLVGGQGICSCKLNQEQVVLDQVKLENLDWQSSVGDSLKKIVLCDAQISPQRSHVACLQRRVSVRNGGDHWAEVFAHQCDLSTAP